MRRIRPMIDTRIVAPAQSALALKLLTEMELLKLKTIARLYARGLPPDVSWEDLLQEALTRVLVGRRVRPAEVAMVPFVAGIMRSLRSEHWRRATPRMARETVPIDEMGDESRSIELRDPAPNPERSLSTRQELAATRLLDALGQELLEASDEEILDAAADLGMNPLMKGSAAFFGLRHSMRRDFSEFFDLVAALPPEHPQSLARLRDKKGSREN